MEREVDRKIISTIVREKKTRGRKGKTRGNKGETGAGQVRGKVRAQVRWGRRGGSR